MYGWKGRIKRIVALALAFLFAGGAVHYLMPVSGADSAGATQMPGTAYVRAAEAPGTASDGAGELQAVESGMDKALGGVPERALAKAVAADDMAAKASDGAAAQQNAEAVLQSAAAPAEGMAVNQTQGLGQSGGELTVETVDLSDWIFQEGGTKVWPEESVAMFALDGDAAPQATADVEGAKAAILNAIKNWDKTVDISQYQILKSDLSKAYIDLVNFNPNLFYVTSGYTSLAYGDVVDSIELKYYDRYTKDHIPTYEAALEAAYQEAIPDAAGMTVVQKARALHDYLVQHVEYDTALQKRDAYTALVEGKTVCQGYSLGYAALLQKAGIAFDYCLSDANNMNHMWNTVQIDGAWYHVDVTWDDPVADTIGYVRHRYFLNSNMQMLSEGAENRQGHYGWTSPTSCTSDKYDNAYWKNWDNQNPVSAIFYVGGNEYYLQPTANDANVAMMRRNGDTATEVFQKSAIWQAGGGVFYPLGDYSRLSYYNGKLYFNTPDKIYAWNPKSGGNTPTEEYAHSGGGLIFTSFVCKDKITMVIKQNPNLAETQKKEIPLPALPAGTITNKESGGYQTSYTYNKSAITAPEAAQFTTTNTGAAMTFEWYKGSVASGSPLSSAPAAAGTYTLRVKAAATETHRAATLDLPVTIAKKALTVTVSAANKAYDGNTTAQITATLSGAIAGDTVSLGTVTGTFADKDADSGKTVALAGGGLAGADAANYEISPAMPASVTAAITKKPVTVTANAKEKTYGGADPALTYTIAASTPLVSGESLTGALQRAAGENAGSYDIGQGTLTDADNPNYAITFTKGAFTIHPAAYQISAMPSQNIYQGVGKFAEPEAKLTQGGRKVDGSFSYAYNSQTNLTYDALVAVLDDLAKDATGTVSYTFTPANAANYTGTATGSFTFTVKDVAFLVGGAAATNANAVTVKASPVYGDSWADIVRKNAITAEAAGQTDAEQSHFTLNVSGVPSAGAQTYQVLYNGTLNGKTYANVVVCSGTVDVQKKTITVTAGDYKVSKTYDGTTNAGTPSGTLRTVGILSTDSAVQASAAVSAYGSPNVGAGSVEATLSLTGTGSGNYALATNKIPVPAEILPKQITPAVAVTGTYAYTGQAIVPAYTVKDGSAGLAATDYAMECVDNIHAGTGKVRITAKAGGNYSWSGAVEQTFTIAKANYSGSKAGSLSAVYGSEAVYGLTEFLPEGYALGTVSVADADAILDGTPAAADGKLSVKLANDAGKAGKSATVTVPVTGTKNYNPYDIVITVTMSAKENQSAFQFAETAVTKAYGSEDFTLAASGAVAGSTAAYASSNEGVAKVDAATGKVQILSAGSAVITATASETTTHNAARASYALTISPKALGWDVSGLDAADEAKGIQNNKATLHGALQLSGILDADKSDVAFSCGAERLIGTYTAVTPGLQNVTLTWAAGQAVLTGAKSGNYTIPAALPQIDGRITKKEPVPVASKSEDNKDYRLAKETGISKVPDALTAAKSDLNTPLAVEKFVKEQVMRKQSASTGVAAGNIAVYDVVLEVNTGGQTWQPVSAFNFPSAGLTITLPYPAGTGEGTHDFVVVHLFTATANGHNAGDVEYPAVTNAQNGITFTVYGLSPVSVGWKERPAQQPSGGTDDDDDADDGPAQGNAGSTSAASAAQPASATANTAKPGNAAKKPGSTAKPGNAADTESTKSTGSSEGSAGKPQSNQNAIDGSAGSNGSSTDNAADRVITAPDTSAEQSGEFPIVGYILLFGLIAAAVLIVVCVVKFKKRD